MSHTEDLLRFQIKQVPDKIFCIPNFVSIEEETFLTSKIYAAPKIKWTNLLNRRLQNWGGLPNEKVITIDFF